LKELLVRFILFGMQRVVRERLRVAVQPSVVVRDIASVVFTGLVQVNVAIDLDTDLMQNIMDGIYQIIIRVASGKKVYGCVNLAIFDALSSLAPRVVEIEAGVTASLFVEIEPFNNASGRFYTPKADNVNGMTSFFQAQQTIGGVLVDMEQMGSGMTYQLPGGEVVRPGSTMGALNVNASESTNPLFRIREYGTHNNACSYWLRNLTWAQPFVGQGYFPVRTVVLPFPHLYPNNAESDFYNTYFTPGTLVLSRAVGNPSIMAGRNFDFPCYLVSDICKYLSEDYSKRLARYVPPETLLDAALAALARVAVQSGQVSFLGVLRYANGYHLPEAIVESLIARESVRNERVALPWVMSGRFGHESQNKYNLTVSDMVADVDTYGLSEYFMFNSIVGGAIIMNGGKTPLAVSWGDVPIVDPANYEKIDALTGTIGMGGLSSPGEDIKCGRWNPTDTVRVAVTQHDDDTNNNRVMFNLKVLSYTSVVSNECALRMIGKLPLPFTYLAYFPTTTGLYEFKLYDSPLATTLDSGDCWGKYLRAALSESGSAKYTALQSFFNELNKQGAGADGILSKVLRASGAVAAFAAPALGYPVIGSAVDVVANKFADMVSIKDGKRVNKNGPKKKVPRAAAGNTRAVRRPAPRLKSKKKGRANPRKGQ
jgi:hypothetical protein